MFLEAAFAGLITDGAVERVVDEEELHDAFAAFFDEFAGGADAHVFCNCVGAGDGRAWHPADWLVAVFIVRGILAGGWAWGHAHLDEAHAAVSRDCELGVVAVVWDVAFGGAACLDHAGALGELVPNAVDLHIDHAFFGGEVFREFLVGSGRCGVAHDR